MKNVKRLTVIGGGLAGCEAAWQAARCGVEVDLYEMRPNRSGPAHTSGALAELVCSNSFRGAALENAVGLLKEELARLGSLIITSARESAVPAGGALAVDRARFAALVESRIAAEPRIALQREEVREIPLDRPVIVACGPLPSKEFLAILDGLLESSFVLRQAQDDKSCAQDDKSCARDDKGCARDDKGCAQDDKSCAQDGSGRGARLHYYDAASPIVAADSIDESFMYRKSRYDKGDGDDYLNIPLDRAQYAQLLADLRSLERHPAKDFEETRYFEGCLPIEEMADRGDDVLRFGPLKPVGLRDPSTGETPFAVVQLRKENAEATAYNLVGFQTRLAWPAQKEAFGKLPGLAHAEWLRLGVMHRNTFIDSPRLLDERLRLRGTRCLHFAGQITGAEGYVEAAACGAMTGIHAAREILELPAIEFPRETAFGAVVAHLQNRHTADFQPSNVTWGSFDCAQDDKSCAQDDTTAPRITAMRLGKRERRRMMAERALAAIEKFASETVMAPVG